MERSWLHGELVVDVCVVCLFVRLDYATERVIASQRSGQERASKKIFFSLFSCEFLLHNFNGLWLKDCQARNPPPVSFVCIGF